MLTQLPFYSIALLPKIAARPSRTGQSKKAITHLVNSQMLKISVISLFVIFSKFQYNGHGLNYFVLSAALALIVGVTIDFFAWSAEFEELLIKELEARRVELRLDITSNLDLRRPIAGHGEEQDDPALREWVENGMRKNSVVSNGNGEVSFTRESLPPASPETEAYLTALKARADARLANVGRTDILDPKDHVINGMVSVESVRGPTVRIETKRVKTISTKSH